MKTLADTVVERMPLQTRAHILDEGRHDPSFWPYLTRIAAHPDRIDDYGAIEASWFRVCRNRIRLRR